MDNLENMMLRAYVPVATILYCGIVGQVVHVFAFQGLAYHWVPDIKRREQDFPLVV